MAELGVAVHPDNRLRALVRVDLLLDSHTEDRCVRVVLGRSVPNCAVGVANTVRRNADFDAAAYLQPGVDEDKLDRIANPEVDAEVLEIKARAIAGRQTQGSFAVSDVGTVTNADAIPQAADELIRLEGITAVVVIGEREGTIHLSGRSRDDRVHMGRALEQATADATTASAGGHARMGGGQIAPKTEVTDGGETDREPAMNRDTLVEEIFASLSGDV